MGMAEEKAGKEQVIKLVNEIVPRAMSVVKRDEPVPWSQNGDDFEIIRAILIEMILQ